MAGDEWLSTEDAAREIGGASSRWVRAQIEAGRLRSRILLTCSRATYRIRRAELDAFRRRYVLDDAGDRPPLEGP